MADIDRLGTSKPLNQLCSKPGEFDYFQAMRVAHQLVSLGVIESFSVEPPLSMANSVPSYSVGVPSISDASLEDGHLTIYSTFFSLFGYGSITPEYFSRRLISSFSENETEVLDFLRFLNNKLQELMFQAALLHYPVVAELEFGKNEISNTLSFRSASQAMPSELRRHFGEFLTELSPIFMIKSRGLSGLRKLLTVVLGVPSARLYECSVQKVVVPQSSRPSLGRDTFELGSSSLLGNQILDATSNLAVHLNQPSLTLASTLLHDKTYLTAVKSLICFYVQRPLNVILSFRLPEEVNPSIRLGSAEWNQLSQIGILRSDERRQLITL